MHLKKLSMGMAIGGGAGLPILLVLGGLVFVPLLNWLKDLLGPIAAGLIVILSGTFLICLCIVMLATGLGLMLYDKKTGYKAHDRRDIGFGLMGAGWLQFMAFYGVLTVGATLIPLLAENEWFMSSIDPDAPLNVIQVLLGLVGLLGLSSLLGFALLPFIGFFLVMLAPKK